MKAAPTPAALQYSVGMDIGPFIGRAGLSGHGIISSRGSIHIEPEVNMDDKTMESLVGRPDASGS